jgi:hypothetical protein
MARTVDDDGFAPRSEFFAEVRRRYELAESVDDLVARYRLSIPGAYDLHRKRRGLPFTTCGREAGRSRS